MAIPDVTRDEIIEALQDFDKQKRESDSWHGWETRKNHRYAIEWNEQLYPVKEIIRTATGGFTKFSGGREANDYLKARGFHIVLLHQDDLTISSEGLAKLDRALEKFAEFRQDEEQYLARERTYKEELFNYLRSIWDVLDKDPEESRQMLLRFMRKEGIEGKFAGSFDNLVGRFGFADREDFAVYLENIDPDTYKQTFQDLFDDEDVPSTRLSQFRSVVNIAYHRLFDEGEFHEGKKTKPIITQNFAAILLTSYDPKSYILYRHTEYTKTAKWLGLAVPSTPEQRYALFLDMAMYVLDYAKDKSYLVHDLIDVHNMIYMLWTYDEFEEVRSEVRRIDTEESIYTFINKHNFIFPDWLVTDYILSLATKPFVILSGISGTGKTKLAQLVAEYIVHPAAHPAEKTFVSVRPDWTDNSYLLGWYNAIAEGYETTPVLGLIMAAEGKRDVPHFIILDEMNIAKVEHYFSDFLSCMESRWIDANGKVRQEPIHLHSQDDEEDYDEDPCVPSKIDLPLNICVTGTVNVDESTYMFSPKVLDRANVIELNDVYLDPDSLARAETPGSEGFVLKQDVNLRELLTAHKPPTTESLEQMKELMSDEFSFLLRIHHTLKPYHMHFGYRVANEIAAFMLNAQKFCIGGDEILPFAFDLQVMQKILPKIHGNASQLMDPIESLMTVLPDSCTMSKSKLARMKNRLEQVGFASFIE